MKMLLFGVLGFILGFIFAIEIAKQVETNGSIPKSFLAACAVGEKPELRETVGTATYHVTFKDGLYRKIECISNE